MVARQDVLTERFEVLQQQVFQHVLRGEAEKLAALLTDDFTEISRAGVVYTRAEILVECVGEPSLASIDVEDFQLHRLSNTAILTTCKAHNRSTDGSISGHAVRSSVWVKLQERWLMRFHQATSREI